MSMSARSRMHLRQIDWRRVVLHEYAHVHVAQRFGVQAHARFDENPGGGLEERHFVGKCHFLTALPSPSKCRLIGLAGIVAECLDEDIHVSHFDIAEWLEDGTICLSDTDSAAAAGFTTNDIRKTLGLVRDLWPAITTEFERLPLW